MAKVKRNKDTTRNTVDCTVFDLVAMQYVVPNHFITTHRPQPQPYKHNLSIGKIHIRRWY